MFIAGTTHASEGCATSPCPSPKAFRIPRLQEQHQHVVANLEPRGISRLQSAGRCSSPSKSMERVNRLGAGSTNRMDQDRSRSPGRMHRDRSRSRERMRSDRGNSRDRMHQDRGKSWGRMHPDRNKSRERMRPDRGSSRDRMHQDRSRSRDRMHQDRSKSRERMHRDRSKSRERMRPALHWDRERVRQDRNRSRERRHEDFNKNKSGQHHRRQPSGGIGRLEWRNNKRQGDAKHLFGSSAHTTRGAECASTSFLRQSSFGHKPMLNMLDVTQAHAATWAQPHTIARLAGATTTTPPSHLAHVPRFESVGGWAESPPSLLHAREGSKTPDLALLAIDMPEPQAERLEGEARWSLQYLPSLVYCDGEESFMTSITMTLVLHTCS